MRITINNIISRGGLLLCLLMLSLSGWAQNNFTISLANQSSTSTTLDVDVMLTVNMPGGVRLASVSTGINYNVGILNGGTPCSTLGCGSWALVPGTNIAGLLGMSLTTRNGATAPLGYGHLRIVQNNNTNTTVDLAPGTYRVGTFRFTNTVPWTSGSNAQLWLQPTNTGGLTNTIVGWYAFGTTTPIGNATTTSTGGNGSLSVIHTSSNTLSVPLNSNVCATSAASSNLVNVTPCANATNGSATITLSPVPTATTATYTVDGGGVQNATLVSGAFTVSGLSAASHTVVVTPTGCSAVTAPAFTISGTPVTTNGSLTTSACDTYTWNAAGGNNQTYTTSGTYMNTVGCNTATLTLTINNSDAHTTTTSACDTYTWAAPLGNGQTYTASTTVSNTSTNASGCSHVETLVLTINNSSTTTETQTACNTYTWAVNGQTYTQSGTYTANNTNASGCPNVATLNLTINSNTTPYYADTDGDGYGTGTAIFSCTGQPAGTALVSGDCAPNDPTKWRTANLYVDADNDGYYNGDPTTTAVCYGNTLPTGYTATIIGTDCNDSNAEVNPNHVEILANTIDDNCDGTIDEVGPSISLIASQCNNAAPLANIATTIYSQQAAGAEGYRFEVTNGSNVRTYDSATNSFSLLSLAGGATYATTYTIRVAVKTGGFWRNYTSACTVTTPAAAATTNVIASQCGTTLSNIANVIYANQVTAANQYRFEVTDINTSVVRTFDTAVNRFSLSDLAGGGAFGTTYSIRVALRFGSTWEPYGTACNVSTPLTPGTTSLQASQCNITVSNRWTTLYATQVPSAAGYRFRVTNGATVRFVDRVPANFALGQLTGAPLTPNTAYTVEVAVLYNSVYGAYGPACTITTAGVITRHADAPVAIFEVKSYPNPFADTFKLDINTSSEDNVGVKVYDMIGKLVESRDINVSELGTIEVGSRYSSGVYNVIVSQGANVQTLRVIKR